MFGVLGKCTRAGMTTLLVIVNAGVIGGWQDPDDISY